MIRFVLVAACILGLGLAPAVAQTADSASPALPPGHPALPAATGQLPQGHPDISALMGPATQPAESGQPALPPGHPALPAQGGQLPNGHPDINALMNKQTPASAKLVIRAKQGTKDGATLAGDQVTIAWYQPDQPVQQFQARLDDKGVAFVDNLPMNPAGQPLVTVTHAGVAHEAPGQIMNPSRPDQVVDVTVYESAEAAPAWKVQMWHVMVMPAPAGLAVTQVLAVENPSDRNWLGAADRAGKRTTLILPIPAGAQNVGLTNGVHDLPATIDGARLTTSVPLLAGVTQFQLSYILPMDHDHAKLDLVTPAEVSQLIVLLPDGGSVCTAEGLGKPEIAQTEQGPIRIYKAQDLKPQAHASLEIIRKAGPAKSEGPQSSSAIPKIAAAVGGGSLLAIGAGVALAKSPRRKPAGPA